MFFCVCEGGRDKCQRSIITIPAGTCLEESGIESLASILKYYVHVAR